MDWTRTMEIFLGLDPDCKILQEFRIRTELVEMNCGFFIVEKLCCDFGVFCWKTLIEIATLQSTTGATQNLF